MRHFALAWFLLAAPLFAQGAPEGLSAPDWAGIRAAHGATHRAILGAGCSHDARNDGQGWSVHFDERGFVVRPDSVSWTWGLDLVAFGFAGSEREHLGPCTAGVVGGRLVRRWGDALDEWYENRDAGLEHGYTVHTRPAGAGMLRLHLRIRGDLEPTIRSSGAAVAFAHAGRTVLDYSGLRVSDADGRTLPARFDAVSTGLLLSVDERGARYPLTIDPIAQQAYLKASNTDGNDQFGSSVAISGDTVVVGAPGEDSSATGVNGNQADNSAFDSGAAYVFVRTGAGWSQQAYLKASNTGTSDGFGFSVAISGDTVVVGALNEDSNATGVNGNQADNSAGNSGAAYVFVRSGGVWSQQAYLKASNTQGADGFGKSVAVSGDTVVAGAPYEGSNATGVNGNQADNSAALAGAAYVFVRSGGVWSQQAYVKASNTGAGDSFGDAVAVSSDTAVVGAHLEGSSATGVNGNQADNSALASGAAYVFVRSGAVWSQQAYLKASNTDANDEFAATVGASGNTIVVGAANEDSSATGVNGNQADNSALAAGAAYVFVRSGTVWSQQAYLKASNTGAFDGFAAAVGIAGDTIVIGARAEASGATGVNGNQADDSTTWAGAAYVFERSGGVWTQQAYLKASNTNGFDVFGTAIAIAGDTVVVGAPSEASNATGVNGNQANNSSANAGAAYAFHLRSGCTGTNGRPLLWAATAPQIGQTYTLSLTNLNPTYNLAILVFGFTPFPLPGIDLGPVLNMPGCFIYHSADVLITAPVGSGGATQWNWSPVTGSPGDTFRCQALCFDPPANAFGWTISNEITTVLTN